MVHSKGRTGWRVRAATAFVVAGALTVFTPSASAEPASAPEAAPAPVPAPVPAGANTTSDITLITGDVVHMAVSADGTAVVTISPATRPDGTVPVFWQSESGHDLTVLPSDVAPLLGTRLDPALFDVTSLLAQGYGDAQSSTIPLIATYEGTPPAGLATPSSPSTTVTPAMTSVRRLPSINGAAMQVTKASAAKMDTELDALAGRRPTVKAAGPLTGVRKLWLDERVKAALDGNLTQIGAPQAWDAGFDGTGVTVAVLDTGIDTTHPDLAGVVTASQNFTPEADAVDHFGHGTHVASIIAGRGTASDGARMGVAHGATLLNGKVLNDSDQGLASWLIAGMEWASSTEHADVVNMSLSFPPGSPAGTPVTDAVNQLTAANNTLFVVSAGNLGCSGCIGSPSDAASALTVGAVDSHDQLAGFSSQGPVSGSDGLKPDITAPGVDIIAARAAGTNLGPAVGDQYTTLSGTSMSAPHVAGAAADLLQARGPMQPQDLKAALMDTAQPTAGVPVFGQGAGRLDLGRAIDTKVVASPGAVDFGRFAFPYPQAPSKTITYSNGADHPITLTLSSDLGTVHLSPAQLTVPAGGTASAQVVVDTSTGAVGTFGGTVTASGDGVTVHNTVGFTTDPQLHDVHIPGIARDGRPAFGNVVFTDLHNGNRFSRDLPSDPSHPCTTAPSASSDCVRLPEGTYSVTAFILTMLPDGPSTELGFLGRYLNTSLVSYPQALVDKDMTLTLDARKAQEVTISTPGHQTRADAGGTVRMGVQRTLDDGTLVTDTSTPLGRQLEERFFMQPTQPVTIGTFRAFTQWRLEAPDITFSAPGVHLDPMYVDIRDFGGESSVFPRLSGTASMPVVDAGTGSAAELAGRDLHGALALVRRSDGIAVADQSNNAAAAGARMVAVYNDGPGVDSNPGVLGLTLRVPTVRLSHEEGTALLAQPHITVVAHGVTDSPYVYDLVYGEKGHIPADLHHVARIDQLAAVTRHFHGEPGRATTFSESAGAFQPGDISTVSPPFALTGGARTRIDYHVGDPEVHWSYEVQTPEKNQSALSNQAVMDFFSPTSMNTYRPGERTSDHWVQAPLGPGLSLRDVFSRTGDSMHVHMGIIDSAGDAATEETSFVEHGITTDFQLSADGQQVAETTGTAADNFPVPGGAKTFRMDYRVDNDAPWAVLSTRTNAQWTWPSQTTTGGKTVIEPLITADYDLDLDLDNQLPASQPAVVGLNLAHQTGSAASPISSASLDYSTDDGTTWHALPLQQLAAGRYQAVIAHPTTGFVSLRLHAADEDGATMSQQIIRAFAVAGAH